ncbi:hypothetical protein MmiHf6_05520 [Methanimicrococcus hongohii]|uniref:FeoB-associated Cys-rich membrane protein n=1 Tax=Methanimicrococcus hongohii TaxID=3028295 RepID=A0AA96UYY8_9EURY|nr:hypothetical protein [Methanimicrococcus sp. Hf6]WNY23247.1 hypothetical protein MmiHf6_05520 [Methanimicrococcus sp. Hf6]
MAADIASLIPQLLVYALLLFAAYILFRQVRKMLKGETGCAGCSTGGGCSKTTTGGSCCGGAGHDKKENELETVKR